MDRQTDRLPHLTSLLFHSSTNMVRTSCHISVHNIFSSYYSLLHLVSSLYPLPLALSPPCSLSGHYEVEIKAPSEPPRRTHIASVSEAKYIKRQTDRDKQCPVSSKIAFPSNLPSVLCSSLLHLSTVSNECRQCVSGWKWPKWPKYHKCVRLWLGVLVQKVMDSLNFFKHSKGTTGPYFQNERENTTAF